MAVRAETDITLTRVDDGAAGSNGATFTPSVDVDGDISWTNDAGLPNPPTQNIMGPAGSSGLSVTGVKTQYYLSTSDSSPTGGSWSDTPQAFVSGNYYWTRDYIDYSDGTHDTSTPVYNQGLTLANEYAMSASDAADSASEYAARAYGNLSTVQNITETLTWITQHGSMALTTDVTPDPTHVYFVVDAGGDYTVGGVTYAIVTEPNAADIGTYYELTIDQSLNNYVGTHLALDGEGLWLLPATSGTDKVLIATGAGSIYTTAGVYIIDSIGTTVASFRSDGATLGDPNESHIDITPGVLEMVTDKSVSALQLETSGKESLNEYNVSLSNTLSPSDTYTFVFDSNYDDLAAGSNIVVYFSRHICQYYRTSPTQAGKASSIKKVSIQLKKGTSTSGSFNLTFIKSSPSDITDTETLTVSYSYDGTDLTITTPAYYYDPDVGYPSTVGTYNYNNELYCVAKAVTYVYAPLFNFYGDVNVHDEFRLSLPNYASQGTVWAASMGSGVMYGTVVTYTPTTDTGNFSKTANNVAYIKTVGDLIISATEVKLNIDSTGLASVYYNGSLVSGTYARWKGGQTLGVYYDGSNYQVFTVLDSDDAGGELAAAINQLGWDSDVIV